MKAEKIFQLATAHIMEDAGDPLNKRLTIPLLQMGIAELTYAENAFRYGEKELISEPASISSLDDDIPYDWNITSILLPLWLAWKFYEGNDDFERATYYKSVFETKRGEIVPATLIDMEDYYA